MTTGERIKKRRKEIGMSAETLAARIGKSPATVYRYENGDIRNLDSRSLMPIAEALDTTPDYLMGWAFSDRLSILIADRKLSFEDVAEKIGHTAEDIDRMCAGDLEPTYEEFQALARLLNVVEDCLSGKTAFDIVEPGAQHDSADLQEQELVGIYRDLNDQGQSILMGTARGLSANPEMQRPEASTAK